MGVRHGKQTVEEMPSNSKQEIARGSNSRSDNFQVPVPMKRSVANKQNELKTLNSEKFIEVHECH